MGGKTSRVATCTVLSPFSNIPLARLFIAVRRGRDELQIVSLLLGLRFNFETLSFAILPFSADCSLSAGEEGGVGEEEALL